MYNLEFICKQKFSHSAQVIANVMKIISFRIYYYNNLQQRMQEISKTPKSENCIYLHTIIDIWVAFVCVYGLPESISCLAIICGVSASSISGVRCEVHICTYTRTYTCICVYLWYLAITVAATQ